MILIDNQVSGASLSKYTYTYDVLACRTDRAQSGSAINSTGTDAFSYNSRSEVAINALREVHARTHPSSNLQA